MNKYYPDLTDCKTSMTSILSNNTWWPEATSAKDLLSRVKEIFKSHNLSTKASNRLLTNISKCSTLEAALSTVYNSILCGADMSVIR